MGRRPFPTELSPLAVGRGPALVADAYVLGPAAHVTVQRAVLDRDGARADRIQQSPIVGDEQDRSWKAAQR